MKRGLSKVQAAVNIVEQTKWPLLGATVIGITAFAPIGLSSDATGEFAGSLFYVLLISLLLSWVTAITLTPFFANILFKTDDKDSLLEAEETDPYQGALFNGYKGLLNFCMRNRWLTVFAMVGLLVTAIMGFSQVKNAFFPASNTPMFYLDYWRYQGADIRQTKADVEAIEKYLLSKEKVEDVTSTIGQGAPRFMLTYGPEKAYGAYAQLIIRVTDKEQLNPVMADLRQYTAENFLDAQVKIKRMEIGPSTDAKIEARFTGPDPDVLRQLSEQAKAIFRADAGAFNVKDDWRERTKVIRPQLNEHKARRLGINKSDVDALLLTSFSGNRVGLYRDGTQMLPIIARSTKEERLNVDSLMDLQIYSPALKVYLPITQVVDSFEIEWEDSLIMRRDRKRTITVMADHYVLGDETAAKLFSRLKGQVEAIELPHGYHMEWGGEYESSADAQAAIFGSLPLGYLAMFGITVLLFNSFKRPPLSGRLYRWPLLV